MCDNSTRVMLSVVLSLHPDSNQNMAIREHCSAQEMKKAQNPIPSLWERIRMYWAHCNALIKVNFYICGAALNCELRPTFFVHLSKVWQINIYLQQHSEIKNINICIILGPCRHINFWILVGHSDLLEITQLHALCNKIAPVPTYPDEIMMSRSRPPWWWRAMLALLVFSSVHSCFVWAVLDAPRPAGQGSGELIHTDTFEGASVEFPSWLIDSSHGLHTTTL